ncbi:MAG: hypothetical protein M3069_11100 [Chloroflexota bacterium]|nr:hypothetical protein [Chloroflexota bacterium]
MTWTFAFDPLIAQWARSSLAGTGQQVVLLWGLQEAQVIALVTGALALSVFMWRSLDIRNRLTSA